MSGLGEGPLREGSAVEAAFVPGICILTSKILEKPGSLLGSLFVKCLMHVLGEGGLNRREKVLTSMTIIESRRQKLVLGLHQLLRPDSLWQ